MAVFPTGPTPPKQGGLLSAWNNIPQDKKTAILLGLSQGFGQAAGPSQHKIGLGQVLSSGASGLQQNLQNYENQQLNKKRSDQLDQSLDMERNKYNQQIEANRQEQEQKNQMREQIKLMVQDPALPPDMKRSAIGYLTTGNDKFLEPLFSTDRTSTQKDLIAAGLQPGTPEYQKAIMDSMNKSKNSFSIVNQSPTPIPEFSKLPAGYVYKRGPNGQVVIDENGSPIAIPITGGPVEQELFANEQAAKNKQQTTERYANVVIEDIDRAINLLSSDDSILPTAGFGALQAASVPGTDSHQVSKFISTIKANAGFDRLQQMRDASPTGGALGQVSERELAFLQSAIGNLEQSQDKKELIYNLNRVKRIYNEIIHGPNAVQSQTNITETDDLESRLSKYE